MSNSIIFTRDIGADSHVMVELVYDSAAEALEHLGDALRTATDAFEAFEIEQAMGPDDGPAGKE